MELNFEVAAEAAVPQRSLTLALQSAIPPFATDTSTPAFTRVTQDLATWRRWSGSS